ncbi:PLD nuclease N-terminal domain-containing protein [Hufsiella ginkgonis]|uniref:Cardiolipin synthase N-terminal domain-containing protein n=1 Tax=Hufsiella ginkgonis TaxID=2695274 RepID=A0A7K1XV30_9SPHI|nr:PLD nuclease N-terminal domain-containing protein [Hufsiella ginkgonis]MXV14863.1 hypothetical protein [Hufsiella ginkgonis]
MFLGILFILLPLLLILYSIVDILRAEFKNENSKLLWIIIVLVAPVLGSIIYLGAGDSFKVPRY